MWMKEIFGTDKPVIAVVHMLAMPTDPKYDKQGGIEKVIERARQDVLALQDGGVDGLLFCNEFSSPKTYNVNTVIVATMARVIGELKSIIKLPIGVTVANDPEKGFDLAAAVEAKFIRQVLHSTHVGVYGVNDVHCGDVERHRYFVGCKDIKTMTAIFQEGTALMAPRDISEVVKTLTFNLNPDTLLVYSTAPGSGIDLSAIKKCKEITDTPIMASNGVKAETIKEIFEYADGCVVATSLKVDGNFYNPVDVNRVKELMEKAKEARGDK